MAYSERDVLLDIIEQAYAKKAWHGSNLRGALRRVALEAAAWRPGDDRHNIWEIVLHAAYWKYVVRRRLLQEKRGSFPLKGSDWFRRPMELSAAAWTADLAILEETHQSLRTAVASLAPSELHVTPPGSTVSNFQLISGIAAHDVYHTGQIQLLKKLAGQAS